MWIKWSLRWGEAAAQAALAAGAPHPEARKKWRCAKGYFFFPPKSWGLSEKHIYIYSIYIYCLFILLSCFFDCTQTYGTLELYGSFVTSKRCTSILQARWSPLFFATIVQAKSQAAGVLLFVSFLLHQNGTLEKMKRCWGKCCFETWTWIQWN